MAAMLLQLLRSRRRRRLLEVLGLIALCVLIAISVSQPGPVASQVLKGTAYRQHVYITEPSASEAIPALSHSFLHLLIPATKTDLNLCKTILSAAVLNYSTPILINWGKKYEDNSLAAGGAHLGKIPGVLSYLNSLGPEQDNDLVLMIDGYDTWFQLRPEVLLTRYHTINAQANERIAHRLGSSKTLPPISQKIIFGTQKLCWPHRPDELACFATPPSPLAADIFGPDTDVFFPDQTNPYLHTRQRHMNSGLMLGPVHALRPLFALANAHMLEDPHQGSDQGIFSDILGAQEYQRELLRREHLSQMQRLLYWVRQVLGLRNEYERDRDTMLEPHPARETMELLPNYTQAEVGVGLDYGSELSHATVFAERDADWVVFREPQNASRFWHVKSPRVGQLPRDVMDSAPPLRGIEDEGEERARDVVNGRQLWRVEEEVKVTIGATWEDMPLYTHLWTGNVPVSVHHNAWQNNMKMFREQMWSQMWWQPYAERLLRAHIKGPRSPILIDSGGREWWSPVERKGGAETDNGTWIGWKDLCGNEESRLFGWKTDKKDKEWKDEEKPDEKSEEKPDERQEEKHEEEHNEKADERHEEEQQEVERHEEEHKEKSDERPEEQHEGSLEEHNEKPDEHHEQNNDNDKQEQHESKADENQEETQNPAWPKDESHDQNREGGQEDNHDVNRIGGNVEDGHNPDQQANHDSNPDSSPDSSPDEKKEEENQAQPENQEEHPAEEGHNKPHSHQQFHEHNHH